MIKIRDKEKQIKRIAKFNKENYSSFTFRLKKDMAIKFREKLEKEDRSANGFFVECVKKFVDDSDKPSTNERLKNSREV